LSNTFYCNMKLTNAVTNALLLVFLISGCTARYVPNRLNVPLLQEKNEFRTTVNPRNLQLSYSPVQGLGIMANGFYMNQSVWRPYTDQDNERARQLIS